MRAQGRTSLASATVSMPRGQTSVGQIKLASAPESTMTGTWSSAPLHVTRAVMAGWEAEEVC